MKYSLIASFLLFCGGFLPLSAVVNGNFQEGKKGWGGTGTVKDGILTVTDDSAKGGLYAVSAGYEPITPGKNYSFGALCRTRNVTSRTQIYLRIFDADGKVLKNFATPGYTGEDWKLLEGRVPGKEIPATAVKAKIILQPAAGPADATGSADFRNVFLFPAKEKREFPIPAGNGEMTSATYFKTENIRLHGEKLQQCPFRHTEGTTRLELSWTSPLLPSLFTFSTPQAEEIRAVKVSVWNDDLQKFEFWRNVVPGHKNISAMLNLTGAPSTKKLLLIFDGTQLELFHPEIYVRTLTAENWNAKWIWCARSCWTDSRYRAKRRCATSPSSWGRACG